jgi:hypothetical protein
MPTHSAFMIAHHSLSMLQQHNILVEYGKRPDGSVTRAIPARMAK